MQPTSALLGWLPWWPVPSASSASQSPSTCCWGSTRPATTALRRRTPPRPTSSRPSSATWRTSPPPDQAQVMPRSQLYLKEKLPQAFMQIGWMEDDFRNLTAKVWVNLDNPIKRFFKGFINFVYVALSGGTLLMSVMSQQYNCLMEL